jgi:anti-sigma factor RsiW
MRLLHRHDLVCRQAVELVTDYLEGTLSARARRRFEAHLDACPHCTEYLAQMRETISLTGRLEPEDLTPQARDEFTDLYRRWRSEQR